ncbi:hypothetical protein [Candidatus Hecatella orcuttiae]|uniref:hypothetical protein n=1 Tax=Candidatus Hecatella orcuttiae TaxID=1935119 RepID=UPI002867EB06|nr:hypothetical protein [Candidatus Hecatella orcuttiae]
MEKLFTDLAFALSPTIITHQGGWGDTVPEWLVAEIKLQRLAENLRRLKGEAVEEAGDAEALAYLYTAFLSVPPSEKWTRIYSYLLGKVARGRLRVPSEIEVKELSDYEQEKLRELKRWIYRKRAERERQRRGEEGLGVLQPPNRASASLRARRAWVKIYRRRGQEDKAKALEEALA